jgi:DNA-binding MarR family transcriptional regulator
VTKQDAIEAAKLCPEGRISISTKEVDGRAVVDIDSYIPFFLSTINNSLSRGASQLYRERYSFGIVEWRVISMLAIEANIPAVRICDVISTDKGQVSRALVSLTDADLVTSEVVSADIRKKNWCLTPKGYALHDEILATALGRERKLIEGCAPEDLEALLRVMRQMRKNVADL